MRPDATLESHEQTLLLKCKDRIPVVARGLLRESRVLVRCDHRGNDFGAMRMVCISDCFRVPAASHLIRRFARGLSYTSYFGA